MDPPLGPLRCIFVHTGKIGSVTDYFDTIIKACHSHARVIVAKEYCVLIHVYISVSMCTILILHIISSYRRRKQKNRKEIIIIMSMAPLISLLCPLRLAVIYK